jgi:hypothetical protein
VGGGDLCGDLLSVRIDEESGNKTSNSSRWGMNALPKQGSQRVKKKKKNQSVGKSLSQGSGLRLPRTLGIHVDSRSFSLVGFSLMKINQRVYHWTRQGKR